MITQYILDKDNKVIPCSDLMAWAKWMTTNGRNNRIVQQIHLPSDTKERLLISTVFLGVDHNFSGDGSDPITFETIIFGGTLDGEMQRYRTWDDAQQGHDAMVTRVQEAEKNK